MKLLRYGPVGSEKPGLLDAAGKIRDLSSHVGDIAPVTLSPEGLAGLAVIAPSSLPEVQGAPRLGPPLAGIGQFIAIGLNYSDHAREANLPIPEEPVIFVKANGSIAGPNDDVAMPPGEVKMDFEVELGIVIGTPGLAIAREDARAHIAGYLVANDVSERVAQLERGGTWDKGKSYPGFGPLGPWLVTKDEIPDPNALSLWLDVNGQRRQSSSTANMIFDVDFLVSYVSRFFRLSAGDVIITGTPAGVGLGAGEFLKPGDVVELGIDGLGTQKQTYLAAN